MIRKIDHIEPYQRAICKAHLAASGVDINALNEKPLIAIANSWNEVCPGHEPLRKLADDVKKGILEAGGEPIEFNTIAMCDGIAQGSLGMKYSLPHRDLIADSIEAMVVGEGIFDGVVFLGACDKIIPGMLQAAARVNLPSIFVTTGPCYAEIKPSESKAARQKFINGDITERELIEITLRYYTGGGVCPFLGTANTMACITEALGMMLPGGALIPSNTSLRRLHARASGRAVMKLVEKQIITSKIITKDSLENAATLLSAIGGSLNAVLHLSALAHELGLTLEWDEIAAIAAHTPVITSVVPNGDETVIDLYKAGGVPAIMKEIVTLLNDNAMTVTGKSIMENLRGVNGADGVTIRFINDPFVQSDGIQVLYGNLAPEGALIKTSAIPEDMHLFRGKAHVFENEASCYDAFKKKAISPGEVIVIRGEGPKGGPGMRELHRVTEILKGIPGTAIVTDGRFSGATGGISIGYVCPESIERGPIAFIRNGDVILIDLKHNRIELELSDNEIEKRRATWTPPLPLKEKGYLYRYAKEVQSAKTGAILNNTQMLTHLKH